MSFLVDTNVLSDATKKKPSAAVRQWVRENEDDLYISPVSLAEIRYGILLMNPGRNQNDLKEWFQKLIEAYQNSTFPLDQHVSLTWAQLLHDLKVKGRKMPLEDSIIAATAKTHDLTLVTRNIRDFAHTGINLFNPFESESEHLTA
jgi:toxin FitB